jgi:dTDP-4-amino-4,6-dideoxygalactose transaminase
MNIPLVDLKAQYQSIKKEVDSAINEVISTTGFIGGKNVEEFEKAFAAFCGTKHCVGVGNGTDALFLAIKALGIGHGHEVITTAGSFIATSEAITMTGAGVVFADIDPVTYTIEVNSLEEKISSRTRAILPVHIYGHPADMDPIRRLAEMYHLDVIGDAAQAHGAMYKGISVASLADVSCFSFYPVKNLGAYGDAGAVVTNDDKLADKIRMFANHGRLDKYNHLIEGVNSRLDSLQAAVLRTKLPHLEDWTERRRKNAYTYNRLLKGLDLITPSERDDVRAVYHLYVVRVKPEIRQPLQDFLKKRGISTGIHYPIALPFLKAYEYLKHSERDFPEAFRATQEILSLPMYPELEESQIEYIADSMREFGL